MDNHQHLVINTDDQMQNGKGIIDNTPFIHGKFYFNTVLKHLSQVVVRWFFYFKLHVLQKTNAHIHVQITILLTAKTVNSLIKNNSI